MKDWNEMNRKDRQAELDACWAQRDTREPLPENWTDKEAMQDSEIVLYPSEEVLDDMLYGWQLSEEESV